MKFSWPLPEALLRDHETGRPPPCLVLRPLRPRADLATSRTGNARRFRASQSEPGDVSPADERWPNASSTTLRRGTTL